MSQKGFSKIVLIIILAVVLTAGYFVLAKNQNWWPFKYKSIPFDDIYKGPIRQTDETANWKTYRNEEFGFEVRYPNTLSLSERSYFNKIVSRPGIEVHLSRDAGNDEFVVSIQINPAPFGIGEEIVGKRNYVISDIPVEGLIRGKVRTYITAELEYNQDYYLFYTHFSSDDLNAEKEFDQILSTFKFVKTAQPTSKAFPPPVKKVTVRDLAANPNTYLNMKVQVTGKLINTASSYFPTRPDELVLTDGMNNFQVTAWLPFEVPPSLPGSSGGQPRTIGFYLDKIITVQGTVKVNTSFYLDVIKTIEF